MSRAQLAERIGVSARQIARYEAGDCSIPFEIAVAFADSVGATVIDFVPLDGADEDDVPMVGCAGEACPQDAPAGAAGARSLNPEDSDAHP